MKAFFERIGVAPPETLVDWVTTSIMILIVVFMLIASTGGMIGFLRFTLRLVSGSIKREHLKKVYEKLQKCMQSSEEYEAACEAARNSYKRFDTRNAGEDYLKVDQHTAHVMRHIRSESGIDAFQKGKKHYLKKQNEEALPYFDEAIACGSYEEGDVYELRGSCLQTLGYNLEAIDDLNKAVLLQPHNCNLYYMRSVSKRATGDFDGAFQDHQGAIRLSKEDNESNRRYALKAKEMSCQSHTAMYESELYSTLQLKEVEQMQIDNDKELNEMIARMGDSCPKELLQRQKERLRRLKKKRALREKRRIFATDGNVDMNGNVIKQICCKGCGEPFSKSQVDYMIISEEFYEWCREGYCSFICFEENRREVQE